GGLAETAAIPIIKAGAVSPVSGAQPSFGALSPAATAAVPTSSPGSSTGSSAGSPTGSITGTTGRLSGSLPSSPAPAPISGPIGLDGTVPGSSVAAGDMVPCSKCG